MAHRYVEQIKEALAQFSLSLSICLSASVSSNIVWSCPGCTPKGAYSTRGRSRQLLEIAFSEPLLRTLLRTRFYCKTHNRPPSQNPSDNPSPEPCPEPSQNPSQNAALPYAPLGVHPVALGFWRPISARQSLPQMYKGVLKAPVCSEARPLVLCT